jgi:hypothetical protein
MSQSGSRHRRVVGNRAAALVVLAAIQIAGSNNCLAGPAACAPRLRPQDEVWLVSSRGLSWCDPPQNVARLRYWRFDRQRSWVVSSLSELSATDDPQVTTVVFLHGNRVSTSEAFTGGWIAYRRLVKCADERPVRFVIWSWPSDQVCGPVKDARVKAARTNPAGYYLAWFVGQLHPDVPVSLWGHSFGARIATGAMHLLGGGKLAGRRLDAQVGSSRRPMHVVLLAAALDDHWLLPGHRHGDALSRTDDMLLINNGCDRVLKRYQLMYPCRGCEQALGYVGLATWCLSPDDTQKVHQLDACCHVGKQHQFANYIESPDLVARMRACLLFENRPTTLAKPASATTSDAPAAELAMQ